MSEITVLHNPRCSKSRQALAIAETYGQVVVIEYLEDALNTEQLNELLKDLGLEHANQMIRSKEPEFKMAGLTKDSSSAQIIDAIAGFPKLLERPIVRFKGKAIIARPPELTERFLK